MQKAPYVHFGEDVLAKGELLTAIHSADFRQKTVSEQFLGYKRHVPVDWLRMG
jgi:hypothetical protein